MMKMKEYALIVAGGKGTRIKNSLPKQFMELDGKPILLHAIEAFCRYSKKITIVLVLPHDDLGVWDSVCEKYNLAKSVIIQPGGETRFQSVRNGLDKIEGEGLVAIHDGVRPLVSEDTIATSFRLATLHHCAVAAVRLKESIRIMDPPGGGSGRKKNNSKAVDRTRFWVIQTPQTFDVQLIKKAYRIKEDSRLTDDASVAERGGHFISLFEGSYENIKITTPEDFTIAEALIRQRK
jgi:2-C-methyl-D-erythritol 4-phosphate cytidylyltransferase